MAAGLSVLDAPEPDGDQVYALAPPTLTVTELPLQMVVLVIDAVTVGTAFTEMATVVFVVQLPLVPVTVYTVLEDGLTLIVAVVCPPGIQA